MNEGSGFTQQVCFLSQQTAEKAIKAGLILLQIEFPFVHNLDQLRDLLPRDWHCRQQCPDLEALTDWAVKSRYPIAPTPSLKEAQIAFQQAQRVLESIEKDLEQGVLFFQETGSIAELLQNGDASE